MLHPSNYLQQVNSASYRHYYPAIKLRVGKRNIVVEHPQLTELLFLHILSQKENFAYCGVLKKVDSRTGANHTYMSHPLNHSDQLCIIGEYLASDLTKYATEKKYSLYQGCITYWLRTFVLEDNPQNEEVMAQQQPSPETLLPHSEKDELQSLRRENRELKSPT